MFCQTLGSGGAILRGSSPLSGKYFIVRDLEYNKLWTLNALSQQMQACVTMFELAFYITRFASTGRHSSNAFEQLRLARPRCSCLPALGISRL